MARRVAGAGRVILARSEIAMANVNEHVCDENEAGERLDNWLKGKAPEYSRTRVQKLIGDGKVLLNGKTAAVASYRLRTGDRVFVEEEPSFMLGESVCKEDIGLTVLYEDEHMIAIDKPKGMTVHPAAGVSSGTLVNALLWHCEGSLSDINGVVRPGIVHRLDRDTSGVIIAAKSNKAHLELSKSFSERKIKKEYNAIVCGNVKNTHGRIDLPIGRDPNNRKRMAVLRQGGRQAITLFEVQDRLESYTWLKIGLVTGRTHQIRVHMAYIGHPVAGDYVYGPGQKKLMGSQMLHSTAIELTHPISGEPMRIESPLPVYYIDAISRL